METSLSRGITGFWRVTDPPLRSSDFAAFRAHCHEAARILEGRVQSVETPNKKFVSNFAQAVLDLQRRTIAILLNTHFPVIAFAEPVTENRLPLNFIEDQPLEKTFRDFGGYEVWSLSKLNAPITPEVSGQLASAELEQIEYWRPKRIGDLAFNFWD